MNITYTIKTVQVRHYTIEINETDARAIIADPAGFARQLQPKLYGRANGASATTKAAPRASRPKGDKPRKLATCPICEKRLAPWFLDIHMTRKHPAATAAAVPDAA